MAVKAGNSRFWVGKLANLTLRRPTALGRLGRCRAAGFRLFRRAILQDSLASHIENRGGPSGEKIKTGNQFRNEPREKGPMPPEQPRKNHRDDHIEERVHGRQNAFDKQRQAGDLNGIGRDRNQPSQTVLRKSRCSGRNRSHNKNKIPVSSYRPSALPLRPAQG